MFVLNLLIGVETVLQSSKNHNLNWKLRGQSRAPKLGRLYYPLNNNVLLFIQPLKRERTPGWVLRFEQEPNFPSVALDIGNQRKGPPPSILLVLGGMLAVRTILCYASGHLLAVNRCELAAAPIL